MPRIGIRKTALSLAVGAAFAGSAFQAHASAFGLIEQNASGLGNAYAGAAAAAEDASTIFFNPAGMSLLPSGGQIVVGVALIQPSVKFTDSGQSTLSGTGANNGGDAGSLAKVPNFYFAMDLAPNWKTGIGVSVPFGLKTEYDPNWVGRTQAIKSEIDTMNINPSFSYKLSDTASLGFGLNYQSANAELTNATATSIAKTEASDGAWGYNLGAMFQLAPETRLGVTYRSSIKHHVTGSLSVGGNFVSNANIDLEAPDTFSVALNHRLAPSWTLLGDLTWTGWSKVKNLTIKDDAGTVLGTTPENFRDTWRVGVGATYRYSDDWSIKMGTAYDQTPVNNTDRTPRLPDQNRLWLSFGGQYKLSKDSTLDFGYAHLFLNNAPNNTTANSTTLVGTYKGSVDILGVQFAHRL